jgi:hypothetical protein
MHDTNLLLFVLASASLVNADTIDYTFFNFGATSAVGSDTVQDSSFCSPCLLTLSLGVPTTAPLSLATYVADLDIGNSSPSQTFTATFETAFSVLNADGVSAAVATVGEFQTFDDTIGSGTHVFEAVEGSTSVFDFSNGLELAVTPLGSSPVTLDTGESSSQEIDASFLLTRQATEVPEPLGLPLLLVAAVLTVAATRRNRRAAN